MHGEPSSRRRSSGTEPPIPKFLTTLSASEARESAGANVTVVPDALETVRTGGTFYLFPRVKGCTDSRKLVLDILQSTKTLVLPGTIFGDAGEGHIRLSIGPLTSEAIDEAFDRLAKYFNSA